MKITLSLTHTQRLINELVIKPIPQQTGSTTPLGSERENSSVVQEFWESSNTRGFSISP